MKLSSETLQNLPFFWNMKTYNCSFSFLVTLFFHYECPGLCQHRPEHPLLKIPSCLEWKKNYLGLLIPKIWQILKRFTRQFHQASERPKRVNTETTETEISVRFTEPKLPNRNTAYIKNVKNLKNVLLNLCNCIFIQVLHYFLQKPMCLQ